MVTNGALADVLSNYSAYEDSATILGSMYKMADSAVNSQLNFDFDPEEVKKDVVTTLIDTFSERKDMLNLISKRSIISFFISLSLTHLAMNINVLWLLVNYYLRIISL